MWCFSFFFIPVPPSLREVVTGSPTKKEKHHPSRLLHFVIQSIKDIMREKEKGPNESDLWGRSDRVQ